MSEECNCSGIGCPTCDPAVTAMLSPMNTPTASDGAVAWRANYPGAPREWNLMSQLPGDADPAVIEYAYTPIDRAKLLALAERWDSEVARDRTLAGDAYDRGAEYAREQDAAELRALLGEQA